LLSFVGHSIEEGFVRREYRRMIPVTESPEDLLDLLASYEPLLLEK
jgi:predicted Rossmann-fold nucleotide-binding protein